MSLSPRVLLCTVLATAAGIALMPLSQRPATSLLSSAYAQTPQQTAEDTAITARIKAAIEADPEVQMLQIRIETLLGEVRVAGAVVTQAQADRILYHARTAGGVRLVKDELTVKTTQ